MSRLRRAGLALAALVAFTLLGATPRRASPTFGTFEPGGDAAFPRVRYADSLVSVNAQCVMSHSKLSVKVRPLYVNRAPIGFCCVFCARDLSSSPEKPLREAGIKFACPVQRGATAAIDSTLRTWVDFELYYFSSPAARTKFLAEPERYTGPVTDPVLLTRFQPTRRSPRAEAAGRLWLFASDSTRTVFLADVALRSKHPTR